MLNFTNLLANEVYGSELAYNILTAVRVAMIILMFVAALSAIVLVMLQPSNSRGIDALGGSSETFFGKNKGKSIEERLKKWTVICLIVLAIFSIVFYLINIVI